MFHWGDITKKMFSKVGGSEKEVKEDGCIVMGGSDLVNTMLKMKILPAMVNFPQHLVNVYPLHSAPP